MMDARADAAGPPRAPSRLWALGPLLLLALVVGAFATSGSSLLGLIGDNPPPADEFDVRRVALSPGEVRITVRNPQREALAIASVTVDDAIVPFTLDGPRELARELVLVMNGYDTDGDGENNFYTVNGRTFYYARYPIRVRRGELVRVYLANLTEFDLINSLHLHAEFFRYQPTGTGDHWEYTDTVMQCQGQRGVLEIRFAHAGTFMFHAHQSEFTELGWMGYFQVEE